MTTAAGHDDRKGRHYYTRIGHRFARPAHESRRAARNPYIASAARNPYIAGNDDRKGRHYYTRIGHRFARPADESLRTQRENVVFTITFRNLYRHAHILT